MHDGICSPSPTTIYLKTKLTEDDAFWTKLYAKLMAEFEIERCRQSWPKSYLHLSVVAGSNPPLDSRHLGVGS